MEPAGLRSTTAPDGRTLYYDAEASGEPGAAAGRPPVVFLHGTLANRFAFRKVRPFLAPHRPTMATVLRAHGEGDERTLPAGYSLAGTEVDDLLAVLDAEGIEQADLFAHSTGGSIAVALAARRPERIRRMVLVEPTLLPLLTGTMAARVAADIAAMAAAAGRGDHREALRLLLDFIGGTAWHASDDGARRQVLDSLAPLAPLTGPHLAALAGLAVDAAAVAALVPPTLLVYGRDSAYFEATLAQTLAHLRPDLVQLHVPGAGHNSHLDQPDVVGPAAGDFLLPA